MEFVVVERHSDMLLNLHILQQIHQVMAMRTAKLNALFHAIRQRPHLRFAAVMLSCAVLVD